MPSELSATKVLFARHAALEKDSQLEHCKPAAISRRRYIAALAIRLWNLLEWIQNEVSLHERCRCRDCPDRVPHTIFEHLSCVPLLRVECLEQAASERRNL